METAVNATWVTAIAAAVQAFGVIGALVVTGVQWRSTARSESRRAEAAEARAIGAEAKAAREKLIEEFDLYTSIVALAASVVHEMDRILEANAESAQATNFSPGPYQILTRGEMFRTLVPQWLPRIRDPRILSFVASVERDTMSIPFPQAGQLGFGRTWLSQIRNRRDAMSWKIVAFTEYVRALRVNQGLRDDEGLVAPLNHGIRGSPED
jgi:hypothetical protein